MTPPNTVPITAEELLPLKEQGIDLLVHNRFCNVWSVTHLSDLDINLPEFKRIAAHDYRHYFGEVVDLSKFQEPEKETNCIPFEFMGHGFNILRHDNGDYAVVSYGDYDVFPTSFEACQQWLCDHFTALFKKDRPHDNIKFVWS